MTILNKTILWLESLSGLQLMAVIMTATLLIVFAALEIGNRFV